MNRSTPCPSSSRRVRLGASLLFSALALSWGCSSKPSDTPTPDASPPDASPPDAMTPDARPDAAPTPPLFDPPHGFYTDPFDLTLSPPFANVDIYYTTDGRDPMGPTGMLYTGPLAIDTTTVISVALTIDGQLISRPMSQSYIFAEHIPNQQASQDYPTEWWVDHETGPWPADYEMDPEIVQDPRDAHMFPATFYSMPAVSIVMDPDALFGPTGIHENAWENGLAWERQGSVEIFDVDRLDDAQVDCAISIHGGSSRRPERSTKKSFRLEFKTAYGPAKFEYQVFPDSPVTEFDTLVLRGGYNRTWAHYNANQRNRSQYLRERVASDAQRAMGHVSPRARFAHLFLNGLYWGLYMIQERPNAAFQASYFGGTKSEYDALNIGVPVDGDDIAWNQMMTVVEAGLASSQAYAELGQWLDIEGFTDYMVLNHYLGNIDWPDRNWYAGRRRAPEGRFRFFNWDAELTLGNSSTDVIDVDFPNTPGRIFQNLRANPEWVVFLGDRIHKHLFNDGALTSTAMLQLWANTAQIAEPGIYGESARWGDHWRDARLDPLGELYNHDDFWLDEYNRIYEDVLPIRTDTVIDQYRSRGLYPAVDAPVPSWIRGPVPAGYELALFSPEPVYYTTDGSDPRLEGGAVSPAAILYTGPVSIDADVTIKSRVLDSNGNWSALLQGEYTIE